MDFIIPNTNNKILYLNLYNKNDVAIFELIKNFEEIPKEVIDSCDFFDYLDTTKTVSSIKLEQYLDYENFDPYELYVYGLTKKFIKYTIDEATKEAEKIKEEIRKEDEAFEIKFCSQPLDEETFRLAKEYNGDIFHAINSHNEDCERLGLKTYTLEDYEDLLIKYGFK